jgi:hypothetical protein
MDLKLIALTNSYADNFLYLIILLEYSTIEKFTAQAKL